MDRISIFERTRGAHRAFLDGADALVVAVGITAVVGAYAGIKVVALPINIAEAFARPRNWCPPVRWF